MHRLLYGLPAFALALPTIPLFVLLPTFYGEHVGIGLGVVGLAILGLRLIDVISDPIVGWLSDELPHAKWRRKLPIAIGSLIAAPALYALFTPSLGASVWYLILWGSLLYIGWTAIQVPYLSWAAELESTYDGRTQINGYREVFGLLGLLGIGAVGIALQDLNIFQRFETTALITLLIGAITIGIALWRVPTGRQYQKTTSIRLPRGNGLFQRTLLAWFLNGLANGFPAVCLPLYLKYVLGSNDSGTATFLFVYFLSAVLGIPLWLWLAKHYNKHRVWCLSMLFACVVFLAVPFLGTGDEWAFGAICLLTGLALGCDLAIPPAIQADCADWDRLRFSQERLASLYAYWNMATKLALGLAAGFALPILDSLNLTERSDAAIFALIVIYAVLPIVLKAGAVALMWSFPLTLRKHHAVCQALEKIR